jgi:acetolactate decarboxylase
MKFKTLHILCAVLFVLAGGAYANENKEMVQVSTIDLLSRGHYEGAYTIKELRQYGDFGLGTFNGLNGEMVILDNRFYQVTSDGRVHLADDAMTVPFLTTTFFHADQKFLFKKNVDEKGFRDYLESGFGNKGHFYAIKIKGVFQFVNTRSVPRQHQPYSPLGEVIKNQQKVFYLKNVQGTMLGFWCPGYAAGMNVPGFHFHFLTQDQSAGGHVLSFKTGSVVVEIEEITQFRALLLK